MGRALEQRYGISSEALEFFALFSESAPSFEEESIEVIAEGLERGVERHLVARSARLLQGYELMYWDTMFRL